MVLGTAGFSMAISGIKSGAFFTTLSPFFYAAIASIRLISASLLSLNVDLIFWRK